ncbi:MAG: hypothetical protein RMJ53_04505 [Chitinophagales bacterium]|nr:hypothetical protein [Chitinophagales bacterium]MDW8273474.1 hypothetical protein [Chitinophagales bacterium]
MNFLKRFIVLLFFVVIAAFSGCSKQDDAKPLPDVKGRKVWIINEGNFQFGNASIDVYFPDSQKIYKNVFKHVNNSSLGDVAQSAVLTDETLFVVVNNSEKIVAIDRKTYKEKYSIKLPGSSPRYMCLVSSTKAFVSELYAKKIWIINPETGELTGSINTEGWTEQMALFDKELFVAQRSRPNDIYVANVLVINTQTNQIIQRISLPEEPVSLAATSGKVWVLCKNFQSSVKPTLICINASMKTIERQYDFLPDDSPSLLRSIVPSNKLFWINNGVYSMQTNQDSLPLQPLIPGNNRNIYAMDINPENEEIYVADAHDYVQSSTVYRYNKSGILMHSFKAGIITNSFVFE